eukprot:GDKI01012703.1.p1 GENE.GDKI01012703.1~~GDKI01012703.1.p1  ORF type:complete len:629 (-),score=203.22 GDKI01012703.1:217-2103(-)
MLQILLAIYAHLRAFCGLQRSTKRCLRYIDLSGPMSNTQSPVQPPSSEELVEFWCEKGLDVQEEFKQTYDSICVSHGVMSRSTLLEIMHDTHTCMKGKINRDIDDNNAFLVFDDLLLDLIQLLWRDTATTRDGARTLDIQDENVSGCVYAKVRALFDWYSEEQRKFCVYAFKILVEEEQKRQQTAADRDGVSDGLRHLLFKMARASGECIARRVEVFAELLHRTYIHVKERNRNGDGNSLTGDSVSVSELSIPRWVVSKFEKQLKRKLWEKLQTPIEQLIEETLVKNYRSGDTMGHSQQSEDGEVGLRRRHGGNTTSGSDTTNTHTPTLPPPLSVVRACGILLHQSMRWVDERKEKTFKSVFLEPAKMYFRAVGDKYGEQDVDTHAANTYTCVLMACLGVSLPRTFHVDDEWAAAPDFVSARMPDLPAVWDPKNEGKSWQTCVKTHIHTHKPALGVPAESLPPRDTYTVLGLHTPHRRPWVIANEILKGGGNAKRTRAYVDRFSEPFQGRREFFESLVNYLCFGDTAGCRRHVETIISYMVDQEKRSGLAFHVSEPVWDTILRMLTGDGDGNHPSDTQTTGKEKIETETDETPLEWLFDENWRLRLDRGVALLQLVGVVKVGYAVMAE